MNALPKQLSILHVVDSLEFGGLERVVTDLAIEQHRNGHRVCVFSINETQGFSDELRRAGVDVVVGNKSATLDMRVIRLLRHTASRMKATIVHAHNFVPNYYAATALLAWRKGPILVTTCHDMGTRLSHRRLRMLFQLSLRATSRVAMVGQQVYDRFVGEGWVTAKHAQVVLNGIPVDKFANASKHRSQARVKLDLADEDIVIGCVGRLVALKNHQLMIRMLAQLTPTHPRLKLVIVGYGELHEQLLDLARQHGVHERVLITGRRSDVSDLLAGFDIFALPSLTEGVSIALLEACASGLAVIASRVGGNPDIVTHGQTGLLVPVDDLPETLAAVQALISDQPLRQRMGATAQQWVQEHASSQALVRAYDGFYRLAAS